MRDEPWDRIKLVFSQPFKKDLQFGLNLLKVVTEEQVEEPKVAKPQVGGTFQIVKMLSRQYQALSVVKLNLGIWLHIVNNYIVRLYIHVDVIEVTNIVNKENQ